VPAPMSPLNAPDSPTWPDCQLRTPKHPPNASSTSRVAPPM
jgi:hypothetical protein